MYSLKEYKNNKLDKVKITKDLVENPQKIAI
jgi:hypothetical protein